MPQDLKKWTVMVYLAGQNNLAEECVFSLNEMKRAATEAHRARLAAAAANKGQAESDKSLDDIIRVAAQLDATGLGGNEQRYVLTKDNWERAPSDEDGVLKNHVVTTRNTG